VRRVELRRARDAAVTAAELRGLLGPNRPGGAWSEKFLTLTVPHLAVHGVEQRIELVLAAWARFLRRMNRWLRSVAAARSAHWFRVFEWTPGNDGCGHPHFHLWMLCPYLDVEHIRAWWGEALLGAGFPEHLDRPIVHIEACRAGRGIDDYLLKYLTKDTDESGNRVDAHVYAAVYRAVDGKRLVQSSRGLMSLAEREPRRCGCGSASPLVLRYLEELPEPDAAPTHTDGEKSDEAHPNAD
jgi:hypothetical protein